MGIITDIEQAVVDYATGEKTGVATVVGTLLKEPITVADLVAGLGALEKMQWADIKTAVVKNLSDPHKDLVAVEDIATVVAAFDPAIIPIVTLVKVLVLITGALPSSAPVAPINPAGIGRGGYHNETIY